MERLKKVNSITIVGGGTAGWLTACYFSRRISVHQCSPTMPYSDKLEVTIIDKEIPNPIGVGEATILHFGGFMEQMGFPREHWMRELNAVRKGGILFSGWTDGSETDNVWHPFGFTDITYNKVRVTNVETLSETCYKVAPMWDIWSKYRDNFNLIETLATYHSAMNNRVEGEKIDVYADHLDASKLPIFAKNETKDLVNHIESDVVDVVWDGDDIDHLVLKDGREIRSDLFIDCTGFTKLLSKNNKHDIDLSDRLFTNTAVAGRVEYQDRDSEMHPYTHACAIDSGWVWITPITTRIGSGHVFNRNITDIEEAKENFCDFWEGRVKKEDLKVLKWDPVMSHDPWKGNVVSIGLSSGFIEPLESTGIALICRGIEFLEECIKGNYWEEDERICYNSRMRGHYNNAVDIVNLHYAYSQKDTPFWRYVRENHKKSDNQLWFEEDMADPMRPTRQTVKNGIFGGHNFAVLAAQHNPDSLAVKQYFCQEDGEEHLMSFNVDKYFKELKGFIERSAPHKEFIYE